MTVEEGLQAANAELQREIAELREEHELVLEAKTQEVRESNAELQRQIEVLECLQALDGVVVDPELARDQERLTDRIFQLEMAHESAVENKEAEM